MIQNLKPNNNNIIKLDNVTEYHESSYDDSFLW